ncbi:ABC transporter permease [Acidimicrobiia bacterium EGI L10123]|uniref:ABC transporter permease n=1 Tax=Salinilacustrithrix flava TaxID=2957203 RepID=UPI003D7C1C96|nr:ABC transporter permease [Acidimicrobiia bacterium EGI L10123]
MRLAVRELLRRPGRFTVVGGALTVLVLLLLFLGGLLDGLYLNSTGAVRTLDADGIVFSDDARQSFLRSEITADQRAEIDEVDGVAATGGLGFALLGVQIPDGDEVVDGAVVGYELASDELPEPPGTGEAHADRQLEDEGASVGDTVLVGPAEVPLTIVGFVDDTNYLQQGGLWVEPETWRSVLAENRPDAIVADGSFQSLVVRVDDGADVDAVLRAIDDATGATETLSQAEAIDAIPGITEQNATFTAVIGVTIFVAGLVIALFFALLTLERLGLYAVLKAVGGSSRTLVAGVVVQSVVVAAGAFVLGGLLTLGLLQIVPDGIPLQLEPSRALSTLASITVAAVVGALVSLRRIVRIDPASAIGAGA